MSSQDVDTEDSQDELNGGKDIRRSWLLCQASDDCSDQLPLSPQRPSPFPEAGTLTYDPRLGQCHLEEQDIWMIPPLPMNSVQRMIQVPATSIKPRHLRSSADSPRNLNVRESEKW